MTSRNKTLCTPFVRATAQFMAVILTVVMVLMGLNLSANAEITYSIKDGDTHLVITSNDTDVKEVLNQAGVELSDLDTWDTDPSDDIVNVSLIRRQYVTVVCDGYSTISRVETDESAAGVLAQLNIELGEYDQLNVDPDTVLNNEVTELVVTRGSDSYYDESTPVPFGSVRVADPEMPIGEEAVTFEGAEGSTINHYRVVTMEDGTSTTELISSETIAPKDKVISYGTKTSYSAPTNGLSTSSEYITNIDEEQGTFTTSRGVTYTYSRTVTLNATAYTSGSNGQTSTGRRAQVGVVAVDPSYISYNTEMFIMSADGSFVYGKCVAGDCGGAIDDNDVDLYMTSESLCESWGRRNVTAFIITGTVEE